jgi:predicted ATP-binding protein involved in virulence
MRLKSIELKNYRCYQHFKVHFAQGINAIAGVNGSGKTSLLKGIREALALNVLQFGLPVPNFHGFSDGDDNPAYLRADVVGNR